MLPPGYRWDSSLQIGDETVALSRLVWPPYLVEDSDIPEPGLRLEISLQEFSRRFPVWGIRRGDALAGFLHAAVLSHEGDLPKEGWRFAIQAAARAGTPNTLCLLSATVNPQDRGAGLAPVLLERAKGAARELGFRTMIAPVRPTRKERFPELSMEDYLQREKDPWIETHVLAGGVVDGICSESVRVTATLAKWRAWTGLALDQPGKVAIPGGLAPLLIGDGVGLYLEPNVWVRYNLN